MFYDSASWRLKTGLYQGHIIASIVVAAASDCWCIGKFEINNIIIINFYFRRPWTYAIDVFVCVLCCNPLMAIFNDMIFLVPFKMNGSDNKRGKQCIASYLKCIKNIMKLLLNEKLSSCLLFSLSLSFSRCLLECHSIQFELAAKMCARNVFSFADKIEWKV